MRQFTYVEPVTVIFHMGGQTIRFTNGICELSDPSPGQLEWLAERIKQKLIVETTPDKKKIKLSKRAAKKKRG